MSTSTVIGIEALPPDIDEVFGSMIMDPVEIVSRIENKIAVVIGSVMFIIATLGINIVANFVSLAYDIANLFPKHVDFKKGGLIASILAVLVCPWICVDSPKAITIFVSVFGAVLAPLYGVMMADSYLVKKQVVKTVELYTMSPKGRFYYDGGWNKIGLITLLVSGSISIGGEVSTQLLKILPENKLRLGHRCGRRCGHLHRDDAQRESLLSHVRSWCEAVVRPCNGAHRTARSERAPTGCLALFLHSPRSNPCPPSPCTPAT